MTVVNELKSDGHLQMDNIEFHECIARCADKFDMQNLTDHFPDYKSKNPYGLDKKVECILIPILKTFMPLKQYDILMNTYKEKVESELNNPKATKYARKD